MSAAVAEPGGNPEFRPAVALTPEQEEEFAAAVASFRALDTEFEVVIRDGFLAVPEDGVLIALPDLVAIAPTDEGYASFLMRNGKHVDARVAAPRVLAALGLTTTGGTHK